MNLDSKVVLPCLWMGSAIGAAALIVTSVLLLTAKDSEPILIQTIGIEIPRPSTELIERLRSELNPSSVAYRSGHLVVKKSRFAEGELLGFMRENGYGALNIYSTRTLNSQSLPSSNAVMLPFPLVLVLWTIWLKRKHKLRFSFAPSLRATITGLGTGLVLFVTLAGLARLMPWMKESTIVEGLLQDMMVSDSLAIKTSVFILICCVYPLAEEVFFRGLMITHIEKIESPFVACAISTMLFTLAHLNLSATVVYIALGFALGFLFIRTKSLSACVVAHGVYNAAVVMASQL